jgi:hypothetical protein
MSNDRRAVRSLCDSRQKILPRMSIHTIVISTVCLQRRGVRVTVVSTLPTSPPMIADEFRRQADLFTDLIELQSNIGRNPSERPAPREREPRSHPQQFPQRENVMGSKGNDSILEKWSRARMRTLSE